MITISMVLGGWFFKKLADEGELYHWAAPGVLFVNLWSGVVLFACLMPYFTLSERIALQLLFCHADLLSSTFPILQES